MSALEETDAEIAAPGRTCPLHYRYRPEVLATKPPEGLDRLDVLYVVGGLYGNELALERVLALFERERGRKRLIFNGDFHWFDADPAVFQHIQRDVLRHEALRGNVETELAVAGVEAGSDVGCGCAYPDWVGDDVVQRSNRILGRLRHAVAPAQRATLGALPMWQRANVGRFKIGIVHGDAESLAGWGFAQEHLREATHRAAVRHWLERAQVDAFACSHTCLPVFQGLQVPVDHVVRWVFNNGSAGMPNFAGDSAGLLTRIALTPFTGPERRFGVGVGVGDAVFADAIAVEIDAEAWQRQFLRIWPAGSDAHASYFGRITNGPSYHRDEAIRIDQ